MLGCGTVGSQIARLLVANKADLTSRAGAQIELVKVAVRDAKVKRDGVPDNLITTDANSIVNDPSIDLIIEVIGGISPAKELILTALKNGKSVVTANKALLAKDGAELYEASSQQMLFPLQLYYSSSEIELLAELKSSLENTGFVFETINEDNVVISGLPVNVTESEITIVLEELLSDLQDGIPDSSFSQNDTIAKSMAKSLAVKTGTYLTEKEQENLVHNLLPVKSRMCHHFKNQLSSR